MKVSIFIPCLTEHLYPQSGISMFKVLRHFGIEVENVDNQTCCGQPAFNSGYRKEIVPVAEHFIELFHNKEFVVAPSGSCVSFIKAYYKELELKEKSKKQLEELTGKIYEFSEFLVDVLKVESIDGEFNHKVSFHDSCHPLRELKIYDQPRKLIKSIRNIQFVEMDNSEECCGFGGTFSYKFENVSVEMVKDKCKNILDTNAEYCVGVDSSCLMNIEGYMKKHNLKTKTIHIADLLAQSMNL